MKTMRALFLTAALGLLLCASAAHADDIVTGSGTWGDGTPATPESAAGATWSFSFTVSDPATDATPSGDGFLTQQISDFVYLLNGTPISATLLDAVFYPSSDLGLFDLDFSDGNTVNLYGDQVYAGTPPPDMTFLPGNYSATVGMNGDDTTGNGTVSITPTTAMPEPATLPLLCLGLLALVLTRAAKS